jgi:hypothetical protein
LPQKFIGIDFDNTIVSYDTLLYTVAREQGLIDSADNPGKKIIRDTIRLLPEGEERWQQLQALIYGARIDGAVLIDGVKDFFLQCRVQNWKTYIISHKTEFANYGDPKPNLRQAALQWMYQNGLFEENGLGLSVNDVLFGATRVEKIAHIKRLGCTHFIDDLEEVFLEDCFPSATEKILYAPHHYGSLLTDVQVFHTWQQISEHILNQILPL